MYFGGINGFNVFHPDSIHDNSYIPPVVITNFKILNKNIPIGKEKGESKLHKTISETKEIYLSYADYFFSFEFSSLDFTVPEKNSYAYMMERFDQNWIYSGQRRFVTYTNLDAGKYIFRVKGSNSDGIWNEEGASVRIIISPPPWKSWWAYSLYSLFLLGSVVGFVRFKMNQQSKKIKEAVKIEKVKREERELVRRKSSADFHDEAGHILTKINLFTELAKRNTNQPESLKKYLLSIEENTKSLSSGMRDFIWVLDPGQDSLFDTLNRLEQFGNNMFEHTDIHFQINEMNKDLKKVNLSMDDRRSIMFIFKEAMNNCLKYAKCSKVILEACLSNGMLHISLTDNGVGFESDKNKLNGYGLKNMKARSEKIGAHIEIQSNFKKGTMISIKKQVTQMGH